MIDTHCHLDFAVFSDIEKQIALASQVGVEKIIIPAIGQQNWLRLAQLAEQYPQIYFALGVHPVFLAQQPHDVIEQLTHALAIRGAQCVAIGECGLDFVAATSADLRHRQHEALEYQLMLADQCQLPVILHCRKAFNELVRQLKNTPSKYGGVYHAFSGSYQQACQLIDLGLKLGVGGTITYPRAAKTRDAISKIPIESMVLETDAPDMPLYGQQGAPNHPRHLPAILSELAQLKGQSKEELMPVLYRTSAQLFAV
ncbi:TatD family hydrolase [Thaumasiovibrio sp. DFM-14]|uniref:TatD family hydrolase n=1 Tax=Thaumasiovibrio sp. DFM-14 TaxID=3384792 RepID=UPI0039A17070